jgi:hypothetical protein
VIQAIRRTEPKKKRKKRRKAEKSASASDSDNSGSDRPLCTECNLKIKKNQKQFRTTRSHFICGKSAKAALYHCEKANPKLAKQLKTMKREDPVAYRDIMKDVKLAKGKRFTPEMRLKLISGVKAKMIKSRQITQREGLTWLDKDHFAGFQHREVLWKKEKSDAYFDKELEKNRRGKSKHTWSMNKRTDEMEIGMENSRTTNFDESVTQEKLIKGTDLKKVFSGKTMQKLDKASWGSGGSIRSIGGAPPQPAALANKARKKSDSSSDGGGSEEDADEQEEEEESEGGDEEAEEEEEEEDEEPSNDEELSSEEPAKRSSARGSSSI